MKEITFEIKEHLGVLSERSTGYKKELNLVSWNDAPAKYDIREWNEDHSKLSKGTTLSLEEVRKLKDMLNQLEV